MSLSKVDQIIADIEAFRAEIWHKVPAVPKRLITPAGIPKEEIERILGYKIYLDRTDFCAHEWVVTHEKVT